MKMILIIMGRYLPGYKDGGPIRSIKNLVDRLGGEYDFRIITADRDLGDEEAYPDIVRGDWNQIGAAKVYYVKPGGFDKKVIAGLAKNADLVYVCGCFNDYARTTLKLKKQGRIRCRVVIAAMGLFSPGAFHIKYPKKKAYMILLKGLGYFKNMEWAATSEEEVLEIKRQVGEKAICHIAEDLPRKAEYTEVGDSSEKGTLKVIFLSRISKKKNLLYAIELLKDLEGAIRFHIYGTIEDVAYWEKCKEKLERLPKNIDWSYLGEALSEDVLKIFSDHDVFLFPTLSENYGHVILEAMSGGCIPIISDKTPWTMEKMERAGEAVTLENEAEFRKILQRYIDMDEFELKKKRKNCQRFAGSYLQNEVKKIENDHKVILNGDEKLKGAFGNR